MWVQWAKWGWHNQKSKGHDLRAASADEGCGVTLCPLTDNFF